MAGNSKGIRAGQAWISLSLNDTALSRGLASVQAKLQRFGSSVRNVGLQMAGLGTAMLAPLAMATKSYADFGSQIYDLSKRTGMSTEALSTLGYAAEQSGTSIQGLEAGIRRMSKVIQEASTGASGAGDTLRELGLSVSELQGLSVEGRFDKMLQALANIDDDGKRAALAMEAFGKSGTQLLPMLDGGFEGLQKLRGELRDMGGELSVLDARQADDLGDAIGKLSRGFAILRNEVAKALAPTVTAAMTRAADGVRLLSHSAQGATAAIAALGIGTLAFSATLNATAFAISGVTKTLGVLVAVLSAGPAGVFAATALALGGIVVVTKEWDFALQTVKGSLDLIRSAMEAGDFELAMKIAATTFSVVWLQAIQDVRVALDDLIDMVTGKTAMRYAVASAYAPGRQLQQYVEFMNRAEDMQGSVGLGQQEVDKKKAELNGLLDMARAVQEKARAAEGEVAEQAAGGGTGKFWFNTLPDKLSTRVNGILGRLMMSAMIKVKDKWMDIELAAKNHLETVAKFNDVWEDTRTPLERYRKRIEELNELRQKGLNEDVFNRAVKQARDDLRNQQLAEIDVTDMSGVSMFGGNYANQVFAAETFQRQAIAVAKEQLGKLGDIERAIRKGGKLAFK